MLGTGHDNGTTCFRSSRLAPAVRPIVTFITHPAKSCTLIRRTNRIPSSVHSRVGWEYMGSFVRISKGPEGQLLSSATRTLIFGLLIAEHIFDLS
jgi:hypothetical protein